MTARTHGGDRHRLDALLRELLDLDDVGARERRLRQIGAGAPADERALRRLLRHATDPAASPLDAGPPELWSDAPAPAEEGGAAGPDAAPPPTAVGPWRLVRELGRGGMGAVYLGRRADGEFQQEAAIKLVQVTGHDREILRRFELERQILAGLRHPNIAQLLDGGRTAEGHPYFAMEYVRGEPIDRYCDQRRLTVRERLGLFLQVCRAVESAHRSLVVHRDLKPANIVVTEAGEVKLLDFGIAKLLGPRPLGTTDAPTATVARVLTPEYASPEQVRGEPITTSSDVYQLGLLLYELLTGRRPQRPEDRTLAELERAVCERRPTRPSRAADRTGADPSVAWARRSHPDALARRLRGDLDNMVMLALRKEPERRYASVSQLRDDVERHLRGLPVSARAPTLAYRTGKFLRRHALATAAATAFVLLLLGYAFTATVQGRKIRQERDRAEVEATRARRVTDFLADIFRAADPYRHRGDELTARELLEAGAAAARAELAGEPEVLSEMLVVLGSVSGSLGSYERAEELLEEALGLEQALDPTPRPEVAELQILLAAALNGRGRFDRARELAGEALATYRELHGEAHPAVADGLAALATAEVYRGDLATAERLFGEEIALRESLGGRDAHLARALNDLGATYQRQHRQAEAEAVHRRALALRRFLFPEAHPEVAESLNNLAVTLRRQGRPEEAEPLYREALEIRRHIFGERHPRVANTLNNLAELLRHRGLFAEAEALHAEALAIRREVLGAEHPNVAFSLHKLGLVARDGGRPERARELVSEALDLLRRSLPRDHPQVAAATVDLGLLELERGRVEAGAELVAEAVAIRAAALGDGHALTHEARLALGLCRAAAGRAAEARELLGENLAALAGQEGEVDGAIVERARAALAGLPG